MRWYTACAGGLLGLALAILLVLALPLRVRVRFSRRDGRESLHVWAGPWNGLVWVPVYRRDASSRPSPGARARRRGEARARPGCGRRVVRFFRPALRSRGLSVHRLRVDVDLGSGDAATTAIGVGLAYAAISCALACPPVPLTFVQTRPEVTVTPRYDRSCLEGVVDCIAGFSPGYTLVEGIRLARAEARRPRTDRARVRRERAGPDG